MNKRLFLIAALAGLAGGYLLAQTADRHQGVISADSPVPAVIFSEGYDRHARKATAEPLSLKPRRIYNTLGQNDLYELDRPGFSSDYLISHYAQSRYDWKAASRYLSDVLKTDPDNTDLVRRSLILSTGAGDLKTAAKRAKTLISLDENDGLAHLVLVVDMMAKGQAEQALSHIEKMPAGEITDFVRPLLAGWAKADLGEVSGSDLLAKDAFELTTVHMYNGGLLALYTGQKDKVLDFAQSILEIGRISPDDAERAADLFAAAGSVTDALVLYQGSLAQKPSDKSLVAKVEALESGEPLRPLLDHLYLEKASDGAAIALSDMAQILYSEHSDSSAMLFVNLALSLDSDYTEARLLLASILSRRGRYNEAIEQYKTIGQSHEMYMDVQRQIASLMEEAGREKDALKFLNRLFVEHNDVEALIYYGDIQRSKERYGDALSAYNRAAAAIGAPIPEEYWHLLYARGMAYEREGEWDKAETDLKAALSYRPDHPYLLNYLGYGWADQGLNLEESLDMIERAAALEPRDGYIRDSLGWVLYMMGRYEEAIPHLEEAVELMPYDATLNDHLGDAYWQVGRYTEARYQWERAINNAEDPALKMTVSEKLDKGLVAEERTVREAKSEVQQQTTSGAPSP